MDKFELFSFSEQNYSRPEAEGAVPKDWFQTVEGEALFKDAAQNLYYPEIRNDWSEKIVYELSKRLSLPAARYELANFDSSEGLIPGSISFKLPDYDGIRTPIEAALEKEVANYNYGSDYSVSSVVNVLEQQNVRLPPNYSLPEGINDGADMLVGALLLDAYTSNIDRHSRNFDLITLNDRGIKYLSPIFDNGRSLGSFLQDDLKADRSISDYSRSAQSSITVDGYNKNGLLVFEEAARLRPQAAQIWQNQLAQISTQEVRQLFARLPEEIITPTSQEFAIDLLGYNQQQLLNLRLDLAQTEIQQPKVEQIAPVLFDYLQLNQKPRVETESSVVEFDSQTKTISYRSKENSQEFLQAQYIEGRWRDLGSKMSQSKELYLINEAAPEIKKQLAIKKANNQTNSSKNRPRRL